MINFKGPHDVTGTPNLQLKYKQRCIVPSLITQNLRRHHPQIHVKCWPSTCNKLESECFLKSNTRARRCPRQAQGWAASTLKTCNIYLIMGTDLSSLRLSNETMTTANSTIAAWCERIKITPFFLSDGQQTYLLLCRRILVISVCARREMKRGEITAGRFLVSPRPSPVSLPVLRNRNWDWEAKWRMDYWVGEVGWDYFPF